MFEPHPAYNLTDDAVWFGVPTWIEAEDHSAVQPQLVSIHRTSYAVYARLMCKLV